MAFDSNEYQPLPEHAREKNLDQANTVKYQVYTDNALASRTLVLVAILSCLGNLLWAVQALRATPTETLNRDKSIYAGLERDVPTPYRDDLIFNSPNRSLADAAWESWVVDPGIVALPHNWVKGKMLPQAQHWPWDEDKGLYLLQGFHNMHCLVRKPNVTCF